MNYSIFFKRVLLSIIFFLPVLGFAQQWRVVAEINEQHWDTANGYVPIDSLTYTYSYHSNRGSNYNNDTINCDRSDRYVFSYSTMQWMHKYRELKTYDANEQMLTRTSQYIDSNQNWLTASADTINYINGLASKERRHAEFLKQGVRVYELIAERRYEYNLNRHLIKLNLLYPGLQFGGSLTNTERYIYDINGQGKLFRISHRFLDNKTWKDKELTYYYYKASGHLSLKYTNQVDSQGNSTPYTMNHYYYDTLDRLILDSNNTTISTNQLPVINIYTYNSQGQLITHRIKTPKGSTKVTEYKYTYTPFGYVSEVERFASKDTVLAYVNGYRTRYKYEHYWPVNVKEATSKNDVLTLYPNPATDVLHIDSKTGFDKGYIYNNMGQLVQTINANTQQVDISALPAGNYTLQLLNNDKINSQQFAIVR